MEYSMQEKNIIYEMKRSIVNEFRYLNKNPITDIVTIWGGPDMSIDIPSLKDAFRMGMSYEEKKNIRKYNFKDLFNQALVELFDEDIIVFIDRKKVAMTNKGEEKFIIPDRWYKNDDEAEQVIPADHKGGSLT